MSLRDEIVADTRRPGFQSGLDRVMAALPEDEAGEVRDVLEDVTLGHAPIARILSNHYGHLVPTGKITSYAVLKWREVAGVKLK